IFLNILPLTGISGSVLLKYKLKKYIFLLLLFIVSIVMAVVSNQCLCAHLFVFSYVNVIFFFMLLIFYKFIAIYLFSLSFFISVFLVSIKQKKIKIILSTILLFVVFINAFPFFTDRVFEKDKQIKKIPHYYYDAKEFFSKDPGSYRVLLLPQQ